MLHGIFSTLKDAKKTQMPTKRESLPFTYPYGDLISWQARIQVPNVPTKFSRTATGRTDVIEAGTGTARTILRVYDEQ